MTIWILALILFICLGMVGYSQGAIRVAVSLIGLIVSSLLAAPLSPLATPAVKFLLGMFSVTNPIIISALSPVVVFLILMSLFKIGAFTLHQKVEVYYKYKAGDLRLLQWGRMNKRVGACLGLINALIYLVLISVAIYFMGYWTMQISQPETDRKMDRIVNRAAKDLHSTGLDKAVRAVDPMKEDYYVAGDIVGIVYHNPLASSRLSRYPTLLGLSERPEFQDLANDKDFLEMLQRQPSFGEILNHPKTKAILNNPVLLKQIWALLVPDLKDLREFMITGKSAKYDDEPILGRWIYDQVASVIALKQAKPNLSVNEITMLRPYMAFAYDKSSFVATPGHEAILKDAIWIKPGVKLAGETPNPVTSAGEWQSDSGSYKISLSKLKGMTATINGNKLQISGDWTPLVFIKEE